MQLNSERLKSFVRHISLVQQKVHTRNLARTNLKKQLDKIKKHTALLPKKKKSTVMLEIEKLEKAVKEVIEKEGALLTKENASSSASEEMTQKITHLEQDLEGNKQQNLELFSGLKETMEALNKKFSKNVPEDLSNELYTIKQQLTEFKNSGMCSADMHTEIKKFEENVYKMIVENVPVNKELSKNVDELKNKVRELISQKDERERKVQELEKKIKQETEQASIEDMIIKLEEKILSFKDQGKYDNAVIEKLQEKINLLKAKLANLNINRIEKNLDEQASKTSAKETYSDTEPEDYLGQKEGSQQNAMQPLSDIQYPDMLPDSGYGAPQTQSEFPEDLPKEQTSFSKLNIPGLEDSQGIEFSTKGRLELSNEQLEREDDALDIPPPPPIEQMKKKSIFSKVAEMLGK